MYPSLLLVLTLLAAEVLSIPALLRQRRVGRLAPADVLLPVAPAVLLVIGLLCFNRPAQVGFASILYPPLAACLSVLLLYAKVFMPGPSNASNARASLWILIVACATATVFGATVAPWYE
ncbi:hypothetical protein LYSHEL_26130 [Lysobacter helvus]|uniref:Uncharacterized protein n=2 Tax=Lysobacteraceae TaxID=32033 RepID=A0ABM7Q844_9GAMM|nr:MULTISPECIES: hypothetical protein [Lysobacter]BCT93588.1 hypothetical protein LYSCAS_26120 [Lysobacter caseinilyticus]BCT96742.1 hypothetical protein LYSHEL_26130 [Lysobacter helvus]